MASGALPPGSLSVEIDGEDYLDFGKVLKDPETRHIIDLGNGVRVFDL